MTGLEDVVTTVEIDGGILVGHDGSRASAAAVRWAAELAAKLDTPVHVLRAWVVTNAPRPSTAEPGYMPPLADYEAAVLDDLRADLDGLGLPDSVALHLHASHGRSSQRVLEAAKGADLLVVGSRGEGGFKGLGFGSTADQVSRHAPCPVVIVPTAAEANA